MPAPNELIVELRDIFADQFSLDELADFALELGVHLEDIGGTTRKAKARELAIYLSRHDLITMLATVGPDARPGIDWVALLARHGIIPAPDPAAVPDPPTLWSAVPLVSYTDLQQLQPILAGRPMFMTPESRTTMLSLAGVGGLAGADLNGNSHTVAGAVLDQLNRYGAIDGSTEPGDTALGRLLVYLCQDPALPPDQKQAIDDVLARATRPGDPE